MTTLRTLTLASMTAIATITSMSAGPAAAGDEFYGWSCQQLWAERNQMYKDNGYCFKTQRAINYFGNGGCHYNKESSVPLSWAERQVIRNIKYQEQQNGCA